MTVDMHYIKSTLRIIRISDMNTLGIKSAWNYIFRTHSAADPIGVYLPAG